MDRVAAEIAVEVRMSLQQGRLDALASEQQTQQHARRPAANDAAGRLIDIADLVWLSGSVRLLLGLLPHVDGHGDLLLSTVACRRSAKRSAALTFRSAHVL